MIDDLKVLTVDEIRSWPEVDGWSLGPNGFRVRVGTGATIGTGAEIGTYAKIGPDATIGTYAKIGPYAKIGTGAKIGPYATIGPCATIGPDATIGTGATPASLNAEALARFRLAGESHLFVKWVTKGRQSPGWGVATQIDYPVGAVIECNDADPECVQCGRGLHVLTIGASPALLGLGSGDDELIPLLVRVRTEDILYAGGQWGSEKLRVRRLEVLS